ncbi:energy-coupling factor ABC transporter substrate-binding protein [Clostridium botulinum C]|uniref:Cobalt transport protein CbiN n=3 Tax=Clostridium botulinum TaxID=1491 RepID=A0A9Q4TDE9_CLOBO|nr:MULTISPECIES: energy-coupling factor ABC transporter substrate-binding protein [Clostridium]EGO87032.1 cobalamin biosynthesis protein CbiN [Clostridium botulinum C str. Stockholm]AYF53588.1 energy-coupling factor ABC transporter substrate-binding protein [Clostridium novyi]EES91381.1 cobalt transport protein CbiN [Clostridium botulinum D str. 1873]KEI07707.1 cobalamin biosynthesis protein CbiN [Clostridium sp. K25]MBO3441578.1 energy-coupling factor ABC transporter substrate-binding protein
MNTHKKTTNKSMFKKNLILSILVVLIAIGPLIFAKEAKFEGSDDQAEDAITQVDKNYKPWFSPIWEPPSGEIESLLFALQAAIGAGIIGYYFGYAKGKKKTHESEK